MPSPDRDRDAADSSTLRDSAVRDTSPTPRSARSFSTPTYDMGEPLVDITHATRLAADLEDGAIVAMMRRHER